MNPYGFNPYQYIVVSKDQSVVGFGEIHKEMGVCVCVCVSGECVYPPLYLGFLSLFYYYNNESRVKKLLWMAVFAFVSLSFD
jgi:hypothetical protein